MEAFMERKEAMEMLSMPGVLGVQWKQQNRKKLWKWVNAQGAGCLGEAGEQKEALEMGSVVCNVVKGRIGGAHTWLSQVTRSCRQTSAVLSIRLSVCFSAVFATVEAGNPYFPRNSLFHETLSLSRWPNHAASS
jgi:hypothetical protein